MLLTGCDISNDTSASGPSENAAVDPQFEEPGNPNPESGPIDPPIDPIEQPQIEPEIVDPPPPMLGEPNVCTPEGINAWVDAQMRDYYIYFDQVPVVNPSDYATAADLLDDLRVSPDEYSSISPQVERETLFQEGETFGFGFRWRRDQQGALRFSNIVSGSPMSIAGAQRGDRILAINGIPELDLTDNVLDNIFGELGIETTVAFTLARGNEAAQIITATSTTYTINTVGEVSTFDVNGTKVGYIESSIFLRTSEAELDSAMETMLNENPTDVILDFRYNGGGYVYIAQKFSAQLIGNDFAGRTFQNSSFNSRYSQFNNVALLEEQTLTLDLPRVVILTTQNTASASEAIANNLKPYIDVVLIGTNTRGKPFASVSNPNCDLVLNAMDRITSNDAGENVLGGLEPTCRVNDEYLFPKSNPEDALLGAALNYIETNACPPVSSLGVSTEIRANVISAPIDDYREPDFAHRLFNPMMDAR